MVHAIPFGKLRKIFTSQPLGPDPSNAPNTHWGTWRTLPTTPGHTVTSNDTKLLKLTKRSGNIKYLGI